MSATLTMPLPELAMSEPKARPFVPAPPVRRELVDRVILLRVAAGDRDAFSLLYQQTSRVVYGIALRILGEAADAEEVTVDVYLQVWRSASTFDPALGSATTWLFVIARSRTLDRLRASNLRRQRHQPIGEDWDTPSTAPDPEDSATIAQVKLRVTAALTALSREQREAIQLAYYQGMTHVEIADATGRPLGTIKTQIREGMAKLRKLLGSEW